MASAKENPTTRRVHQSLIKTPLYAGVDKGFLIFELTTIGFLFFVIGFSFATVLLAVIWTAVLHPIMVWINAKDPLLAVLYVRSLTGKDFYVPHAKLGEKVPGVKPSITSKK